jgi:hypothetical protein
MKELNTDTNTDTDPDADGFFREEIMVKAALARIDAIKKKLATEFVWAIEEQLDAEIADVELGLVRDLAAAGDDASIAVHKALELYRNGLGPVGEVMTISYRI